MCFISSSSRRKARAERWRRDGPLCRCVPARRNIALTTSGLRRRGTVMAIFMKQLLRRDDKKQNGPVQ